jgi:hypothetical protein
MEIKIDATNLKGLYPEWDGDAIAVTNYHIGNGLSIKAVTDRGPVESLVTEYKGCTVQTALNLSYCAVTISKRIDSKPYRTTLKLSYGEDILSRVKLEVEYLESLSNGLAAKVTISVKLEATCPHCNHKNSYDAMDHGSIECSEDDAVYQMDDPYVSLDCLNCKKPVTISTYPQSLL